jgi:hypothetical protein
MAVAKRKTGKYFRPGYELPDEHHDMPAIVEWLESNGFRDMGYPCPIDLMRLCQGRCYSLGPYLADPLGWWISAGDGKGNIVLVRTLKNSELSKLRVWKCTVGESGSRVREASWSEAKEQLYSMVKS